MTAPEVGFIAVGGEGLGSEMQVVGKPGGMTEDPVPVYR
jgi:hypothetical protein